MPKSKSKNRIVIVIESGMIQSIAADLPREMEVTIVDKDYHELSRVAEAADGERAIVEEYPVEKINADHDKWLLSDSKIGT